MNQVGEASDIYDYSMSDQFVSETRQRPYRVGYRRRHHPRRPSLAYINSLPDHEFAKYLSNGCRLPDEFSVYTDELDETRAELHQLRTEFETLKIEVARLRQLLKRPTANHLMPRGLDVATR
ncbi:MAG: hypothetical protein OEY86_07120 [Nitrospira sp.]|nr:hypothetical protein [Nitrospira sp.]